MLDITTVVWGEMANSYLEITLPSLLQEGNIPSCHKAFGSYTFYASEQAKEVITNNKLYRELEKLVRIFWQPLQRGEWEVTSNYLCQMKESASMKSHLLIVSPDEALGNNSLPNLIKLSGKFKGIFYPIPRISEEGYQVLKSLFQAKKVVTNREMVSLLMKYLSKQSYPIVDSEVSYPLPSLCFLPDAELIDYYSQDRTLTGYTFDHCLPYTMVERGYPWHLIDHSDTFFMVERGKQTLFDKVVERGTFRSEREEDIAKTRAAEIFFGKSKQTWQGLSQPVVSIVITCLDMLETTKKCLESFWANTTPIYELIIVAQAPGDEMLKWLESLKRDNKAEIVIYPKPLGAAIAHNIGFRKAKGQYIFSISNSIRVTKGWLYPLLDTLKNHPEYGWVCCKEIRGNTVMNFNASALFSREALFKVGLFDEEYSQGIGFDDDDLLRRFWKAGYKPHGCSERIVIHEPGGALAYKKIYDEQERQERLTRNQMLFYKKWGEAGTDWGRTDLTVPTIAPNDVVQGMHRIDWIRSRVPPEDTILEVGVAENPVWAGTPFKVTTLDRDRGCKPDVVAEAESLPFEPQSFNIVAVGELLEHVPDPQIVLREAARVARKKVIVTVPDEYSWPDECKPFWNPGHVRFYTYSTFQDELKKLGLPFKIWNVKFQGWSHWCAEIYCDGGKTMKIDQPKKLNIGSFTVMLPPPDWINLDIIDLSDYAREKGFSFQQVDVTKWLPLDDNSIDFINCSHLIEHLTVEEGIAFLKEIFRVLRPNCTVRIGTPDMNKLINAYQRGQMSEFDGSQPEEYQQSPTQADKFWRLLTAGHKTCYDMTAIRHSLEKAGFKSISLPAYNKELDMFPEVSLYVEAEKESASPSEIEQIMKEKTEGKILTSPPADIPEYWKSFATKKRI